VRRGLRSPAGWGEGRALSVYLCLGWGCSGFAEDWEDEDAQYPVWRRGRGKTAGVAFVTIW
jgi:hypothetical protein